MVWTLLEILDTLSNTDGRQGQENIWVPVSCLGWWHVVHDKDWCRVLSLMSVKCQTLQLSIWPRHKDEAWTMQAGGRCGGSLNTRLCWDQSVDTQYTISMPVTVRNSALATNWVVNIGPYYILQPPPLYCHRYWTHAWTNIGPLWHFRRGFMRVLYAISWCNCEFNSLCHSFLIN